MILYTIIVNTWLPAELPRNLAAIHHVAKLSHGHTHNVHRILGRIHQGYQATLAALPQGRHPMVFCSVVAPKPECHPLAASPWQKEVTIQIKLEEPMTSY